MKPLFVTIISGILLTIAFQTVHAQTQKGYWLLSGSGSFIHTKSDYGTKNSTFTFYPKGGLFVANNLAVGLMPSIDITSSPAVGATDRVISYSFAIGPFVRYYFSLSSSLNLFAEGSFSYGASFQKPKMGFDNEDFYNWYIGPGAAFFIIPSVSLDIAFQYGQVQSNSTPKIKTNSTKIQFGFSIYLP